jgi:hypothetical protein
MSLIIAARLHAAEPDNIKERLLAARKQSDFARVYEGIDRKFNGDTTKIVEYLRSVGFTCQYGTVLFKAQCVFAYCGDRPLFPQFLQRELMTLNATIEKNGEVWTGVAHHQTACPENESLLKQKQEYLLNGGSPRGGK